ncbi:hypothetical protein [Micromonospora polyrhachis]|uniref:Uncharacterized protein n=1 Tax=Micromonospora polyrhachis TaxID=1282883 RepID=A0A7W7SUN1_9ACTN|nr:hypothetical protein [Micromonospora polyrhachis]MBB4960030.1 hypothetical protein [Micromonospora polyrhachis]
MRVSCNFVGVSYCSTVNDHDSPALVDACRDRLVTFWSPDPSANERDRSGEFVTIRGRSSSR